jgi:hypothetical protein
MKKRLVEEFKKLDIYVMKSFQFQYSKEIYIDLMWTTRGRWISVRDNNVNVIKDYPILSNTPLHILEASIRFLNEKKKEKIS